MDAWGAPDAHEAPKVNVQTLLNKKLTPNRSLWESISDAVPSNKGSEQSLGCVYVFGVLFWCPLVAPEVAQLS